MSGKGFVSAHTHPAAGASPPDPAEASYCKQLGPPPARPGHRLTPWNPAFFCCSQGYLVPTLAKGHLAKGADMALASEKDIEIPLLEEIEKAGGKARPKDVYPKVRGYWDLR